MNVSCQVRLRNLAVDDHKVLEKIWAKFQTRAIRRASDNVLLTYYGFFDVNGNGAWDVLTSTVAT
ncbi:MAG: hypothetical protein NZ483_05915 [Verrucomicrobiae bacterium]|nr:hypothetical protein [Verrucomicrobiae bacterium]